jgi:hypothetical protein
MHDLIASSDVVAGLIGALGSLAGVAVGGFVTLKVTREGRTDAQRGELSRALAGYMQATQLVAFEMASMPRSTWLERQVDRLPTGRIHFFFNRLLARLIFGRRHDELRERYYRASAEVVLIAPIEVIGLVREIEAFFNDWERHPDSADLPRRWADVAERLRLTAQSTLDEGQGRPYRAGEPAVNSTRHG